MEIRIDPAHVVRGAISLDAAMTLREATFDGVEQEFGPRGEPGLFVAKATVRSGARLEAAGTSPFDAAERLLTLAMRPAGRGW